MTSTSTLDSEYIGLKSIPTEDLVHLSEAINKEIHDRKLAVADGLIAEINTRIKQIIANGLSVRIETDEDEILLSPEWSDSILITIES